MNHSKNNIMSGRIGQLFIFSGMDLIIWWRKGKSDPRSQFGPEQIIAGALPPGILRLHTVFDLETVSLYHYTTIN